MTAHALPTRPYQMLPPLDEHQRFVLRQSIEQCGVLEPVVFDEDGEILDGHHRVEIAEELGIEYPRRVISDLDRPGKWMYAVTVNVARRHLDQSTRSGLVAQMRLRGMSIREIAKATGASVGTVHNDLKVFNSEHLPEKITGTDGKDYASTRPTQTPGPVDAADSPPAGPGVTPAPAGGPPAPAASQESDPDLAERVFRVLVEQGNPPFGLTIGEIFAKLDGASGAEITAAVGELVEQRRIVHMGTRQGNASIEQRKSWLPNHAPEPAAVPSAAQAGSGPAPAPAAESPVLAPREPTPSEAPAPREGGAGASDPGKPTGDTELEARLAADSTRRAAVRNLTSVLTFLTPLAITPTELAEREYAQALDEFTLAELGRALETLTAIVALKRDAR